MEREDPRVVELAAPSRYVLDDPRDVERPNRPGRDEVEAAFESRLGRHAQWNSPDERVRVRVPDERERGAAEPFDLERRSEPASILGQEAQHRQHERNVARAAGARAMRLDPAHELGVEPDPGVEAEAAVVDASERDRPRAALLERLRQPLGRLDRVAGQAQSARHHARPAAGDAAERRRLGAEAVQRLVEAAVAGVDEDRVGVLGGLARELGRVARPLGQEGRHLGVAAERALDEGDPVLVDRGRERVHDQDGLRLAPAHRIVTPPLRSRPARR